MADFDYGPLNTVAIELIRDFGRDVTLRRHSLLPASGSPPWAARLPDASASDDVTLTGVRAVFVQPRKEDREGRVVTGTLARVFIAAASLGANTLDLNWQLVDGTTVYEILAVDPIKPGPTLLVYGLLVQT